jgi:C-terminal processing protease CtpA/Prc
VRADLAAGAFDRDNQGMLRIPFVGAGRYICAALLFAVVAPAQWPVPKTAMEAYDYAQARRQEASKLVPAEMPKAIDILTDALAYLDQPLVRDLATGNKYLQARRLNILLDLAEVHTLRGNREEALSELRQAARLAPLPEVARYIESRPGFATLRSVPDFQDAVASFRLYERFWDSAELGGPFRHELTDAERVAGLSKLWSEVKYNFGYPEKLIRLRWDQLYLDWIPKVLAARSTGDYYKQLMLLCAKLEDGHTNVYPPAELDVSAKPPLRTAKIGDRVFIVEVQAPSLEAVGIRAGMEILKVDGEPVLAYARREVEPYQSSSTPQDREVRTFYYGFLRGPKAQPVRLTLRAADGSESDHTIARGGYSDIRRTPAFAWQALPGGVALVTLNSFDNFQTAQQFGEQFGRIRESSAMILDLRQNGGGNSGVGFEILKRLINRPVKTSRQVMRRYGPTDRARGTLLEWDEVAAAEIGPADGPRFDGPVVVLTSAATFSAAEDFLVAWKDSGRGPIIGSASGGSTGQPLTFKLPGGGSARVCTKRDTFPDGREWVGVGIQPDIAVRLEAADVIAGRDAVLERALAYLKDGR